MKWEIFKIKVIFYLFHGGICFCSKHIFNKIAFNQQITFSGSFKIGYFCSRCREVAAFLNFSVRWKILYIGQAGWFSPCLG